MSREMGFLLFGYFVVFINFIRYMHHEITVWSQDQIHENYGDDIRKLPNTVDGFIQEGATILRSRNLYLHSRK